MIIDRPFGTSELKILWSDYIQTIRESDDTASGNIGWLEWLTPWFLLWDQYERVDELSQVLWWDDCVDPNNQQLSDAELAEIEEYLRWFFVWL